MNDAYQQEIEEIERDEEAKYQRKVDQMRKDVA